MQFVVRYLLFLFLLLAACPLRAQAPQPGSALAGQQKLDLVYRYLAGLYVDEVDMGPLVEEAIRGMLGELDPHSAYLSADEMQEAQAGFEGGFSGIGIEFNVLQDTVIVVNTVAGGPAERVGMQPNDRIVRIDTLSAVGLTRADVPKYLRGRTGTRVGLEVVRRGEPAPLHFTLVRDKIPLETIDAAYKINDSTGYIRVNRFGRTTMDEFRRAFAAFGPVDGLILDLRGNSGGLLDQAIEMADFFLPRGALIVSTEGRAVPSASFKALSDEGFMRGRLAVLIDENSASASEIVAGAVQDWDRGVVIGRPSFGKGLVQRQFPLPDGSAVRVTIARYHTPSGRVIQRPYEKGERAAYYLDHYRRFGAAPDSLPADAPLYRTLRSHRPVYGGGGIVPDLPTPADTTGFTPYLGALVRHGVVNEFAVRYLDRARDSLTARYPAFGQYAARFEPSEALLLELTALGAARGVPFDEAAFAVSAPLLRLQLRAVVAQKLFGTTAFYRIINEAENGAYRRAVDVLGAWETAAVPLLGGKK